MTAAEQFYWMTTIRTVVIEDSVDDLPSLSSRCRLGGQYRRKRKICSVDAAPLAGRTREHLPKGWIISPT
jgi:hypothetical protein